MVQQGLEPAKRCPQHFGISPCAKVQVLQSDALDRLICLLNPSLRMIGSIERALLEYRQATAGMCQLEQGPWG